MKIIYSCLFILTFASCTNDENSRQEINTSSNDKVEGQTMPAYKANPYDETGKIYDKLFEAYYDGTNRSSVTQTVIADLEAIAYSDSSFKGLDSSVFESVSPEHIEYLAEKDSSDIADIIAAGNLSSVAKTGFSNFLASFVTLLDSEKEASKLYNAVIQYEETVLNNSVLTANDKRVILTTTSIIRYSSYRAKKKPKKNTDPDWIIFIGHVFGTEQGAEENASKAIVQGLVAGIISNK